MAGMIFATAVAGSGKPITLAPSPAETPARTSVGSPDGVLGEIQYDSVPSPLSGAIDGLNFATTGTAEFGDLIRLHGASHFVGRVTVVMSSAARHADFPERSPLGFSHPITLTLYAVDRSDGRPRTGTPLARITETFLIPWRLENSAAGRPAPRAFLLTYDLAALGLALPSEVIYSIAFDTQHHGDNPIRRAGPYDSLALGLTRTGAAVGTDHHPDVVYWRSEHTGLLGLAADDGWAPFAPSARFHDSIYGLLFETAVRLEELRGPDARAAASVGLAASLLAVALDREFWAGNEQPLPDMGAEVFVLLAEAADELTLVAATPGALAEHARVALETISRATAYLAETALADAVIMSGDMEAILRAQAAVDAAMDSRADSDHGRAVSDFGIAWEEAQRALR